MIELKECPLCKANTFQTVTTCKDNTLTNELFQIQECSSCTLRLTNPRPEQSDLPRYYLSDDYISHSNKATTIMDRVYLIARSYTLRWKQHIIEQLLRPSQTKKLLDVGCGTGAFLTHMIKNGWNGNGTEPSENAREIAEQSAKIKIYPELDSITNDRYDVITLWHVLEHIPNLDQTISKLKTLLTEPGKLIIAVPNYNSNESKHYKHNWAGYDVPRHLWHFSQSAMTTLTKKHGLRIAKIIPMKLDAYYISLLSERYQNESRPSVLHYPKAIIRGLLSNRSARKTSEYSSLIYVINK